MNETFMTPDGQEDYRKFILYVFVYKDIAMTMAMYQFANDMVYYGVLKTFFEEYGQMSFHPICIENSAEFIIDQFNQWSTNKKAWMLLQQDL